MTATTATAAAAVVIAAGHEAPSAFFCRSAASVAQLYKAVAKSHKENGDKAAAAVFTAAAKAALAA